MKIPYPYVFVWGNNPVRKARKGQRCRLLCESSRLQTVLIEFEDGYRMTTSARAIRWAPPPVRPGGILAALE